MTPERKSEPFSTLLRRLWRHISPRRRLHFAALLVAMVFASFAEIVSIGAVLPFLGVLTAPEIVYRHEWLQPLIRLLDLRTPQDLLLPLTVGFCLAALVAGAMRVVLLWLQTGISHAVGADFSISIYRRTLFQPYATHLNRNTSELIAGIAGKANAIVGSVILPILVLATAALMTVSVLGVLLVINPYIAVVTLLGFAVIYAVIMRLTRIQLSRNSRAISRESPAVIKALQEGLGGIRDVLIDGSQPTFCDIYSKADTKYRRAVASVIIISSSPRSVIEALGVVLVAMVAYSFARASDSGFGSAIPTLGALAVAAQRLLPVMQQAFVSWASMRGGKDSLHDALDFLDQPLPESALAPVGPPLPFVQAIRLQGLGFRYAPTAPWVFRGLDCVIAKGERVGFIGSTGSGKSTLLDVIMGLLPPTEGSLLIDQTAVTLANQRRWQAHIAHVPQSIFLADASIAENIAFGVPRDRIDLARVRSAAERAHIAATIESWERKYDTLVGERGVRLSGGQRQRIGVARALYKEADVIVFDEATSALDNDTEQAVMESIESLSKELTVLIVAHRLSTLRSCNRVIELEAGSIRRTGSYSEIIDSRGTLTADVTP